MRTFLSELHRRNVYKVGVAYAVVGWVVIEVASVLFPAFGAPDWAFSVVALLVVLGFPVALTLAWAFELTPDGLQRTSGEAAARGDPAAAGRKLDFAIIGLLVIALGTSVFLNLENASDARAASIAVLPFDSYSSDPQHAMFADGMHDEVLASLANIGSLKVISRTSVMEYRDSTKKLRQIGEELGVATVLEGAVQRSGDSVRINVQLIDAGTDQHLWANTYDRKLNTENLFAIQTEIATTIADKLKATLTQEEKQRLAKIPTANMDAYNLYLAGRQNLYQRELENVQSARGLFEQAIELDSGFAQAYAGLSDALNLLYFNYGVVPAEEAITGSTVALDKALSLETEDAGIYASLGLLKSVMWVRTRDESNAEESEAAFERAIELNPNHAQAIAWYANIAGLRNDSVKEIALYERSVELDPLARMSQLNLGLAYASVGDHERALEQLLETARRNPDWSHAAWVIGRHLSRFGRLDEAMAWYHKAALLSVEPLVTGMLDLYLVFGQTDRAVELLNSVQPDYIYWPAAQAAARRISGDLAGAMALIESEIAKTEHPPEVYFFQAADITLRQGNFKAARNYLERLCPEFAKPEPGGEDFSCEHGVAYAYVLQRLGEAERADRVLAANLEYLRDRPRFGLVGNGIADVQTLALMGRPTDALARLREAIDAGWRAWWSINSLRLSDDPNLVELRDDPVFRAMVAEVESDIARMRDRAMQAEASGDWEPLLALADSGTSLAAEKPSH